MGACSKFCAKGPESDMKQDSKRDRALLLVQWNSVILVSVADLVSHFNRNAIGVMREAITAEIAMSSTAFGTLSAISTYSYLLLQLPLGILADRFGIRRVLALGCFVTALGSLVFGSAAGMPGIFLGRFLMGAGLAVPGMALQKLVAGWFENSRASTVIGIGCGIGSLGALLSQFPLTAWLHVATWRSIYFSFAAFTAAIGIATVLTMRNSPEDLAAHRERQKNRASSTPAGPCLRDILKNIAGTFANRRIWPVYFILFVQMGLYQVFASTWAVSYLERSFGLSGTQASAYTSCLMIGMMTASTLIGGVSDQLRSRKKVFLALYFCLALSWVLLTFFGEFIYASGVLWPVMLLLGVSATASQIGHAYVRDVTDPRFVGTSISCVSLINMLGGALAPVFCGIYMDSLEAKGFSGLALYRRAFTPLTVLAILSFAVVIFFIRETGCRNRWGEWQQAER